jgi:sulfonate transport system substrate-binding protein
VVDKVLLAHGLSERDFHSINLDSLSGVPAIAAREIDGLWGGIELIEPEQAGIVRFVYSTNGQSPTLTKQAHLLVTEDFESRYPAIVQRLVNVLVKEAAWESDEGHRAETFQLWSKMGLPVSTWAKEFENTPLVVRESPLLDDFFIARYREGVTSALEFKLIRTSFDVTPWIEPQYVREAIRQLHLEGLWHEYDDHGHPLTVVK